MEKKPTSFRLTETARKLLQVLARMLGISKTGIIEIAIRRMARGEGIVEGEGETKDETN